MPLPRTEQSTNAVVDARQDEPTLLGDDALQRSTTEAVAEDNRHTLTFETRDGLIELFSQPVRMQMEGDLLELPRHTALGQRREDVLECLTTDENGWCSLDELVVSLSHNSTVD